MNNWSKIREYMSGYVDEDLRYSNKMTEHLTLGHFEDAIKHSGLPEEDIIEFAEQESVLTEEEIESLKV